MMDEAWPIDKIYYLRIVHMHVTHSVLGYFNVLLQRIS